MPAAIYLPFPCCVTSNHAQQQENVGHRVKEALFCGETGQLESVKDVVVYCKAIVL